jgi:type IV secretory pathway VirB4 component
VRVSFETAAIADLDDLHAKLTLPLRNVADERLARWTPLVRRRSTDYATGEFRSAPPSHLTPNIVSGFEPNGSFAIIFV